MRRLQGSRLPPKDSQPPPPDYATVVIESNNRAEISANQGMHEEDIYIEPSDAIDFEMRPRSELGAFSLDLGKNKANEYVRNGRWGWYQEICNE